MIKSLVRITVWLVGVGILVFAFVLALASTYSSPNSRLWASKFGYPAIARNYGWPIPVESELVMSKAVAPSISAEGTVQYETRVPVTIDVPGIIRRIGVKAGDPVKRGDVLVQLDLGGREVEMAKLDVALKKKDYAAALDNLERQSRLLDDGLLMQDVFYKYERDKREAESALALAEQSLRNALSTRSEAVYKGSSDTAAGAASDLDLNVLSPIDGRVVRVNVSEGETLVAPRQNSVELGADMKFLAFIDQLHFGQVKVGQQATLYLLARPNREITVRVARIEPFVASVSGRGSPQPSLTFAVWLDLVDPPRDEEAVTPGMNGYIILPYPSQEVVISSRALLRYSGGHGVVAVVEDDSRVALRGVSYSWSDGTLVAVKEGLAVGERVVTAGQIGLRDGDVIKLK